MVHVIRKDPTSGYMKDVTKIMFTPCERVHPITIFMFEVGVKMWACDLTVSVTFNLTIY